MKYLHSVLRFTLIALIVLGSGMLPVPAALAAAPVRPARAPFTTCAAVTEIPVAECDALVVFYNNNGGAGWLDNTGWLQTDSPCSWVGVSCAAGTNVTGLVFQKNQVLGSLPVELANLTQLSNLSLPDNWLTGSIPPALGNFAQLTTLDLYQNGLTGSIPPELGNLTKLASLNLGNNELTGPIPPQLGSLASLTSLNLSSTHPSHRAISPQPNTRAYRSRHTDQSLRVLST